MSNDPDRYARITEAAAVAIGTAMRDIRATTRALAASSTPASSLPDTILMLLDLIDAAANAAQLQAVAYRLGQPLDEGDLRYAVTLASGLLAGRGAIDGSVRVAVDDFIAGITEHHKSIWASLPRTERESVVARTAAAVTAIAGATRIVPTAVMRACLEAFMRGKAPRRGSGLTKEDATNEVFLSLGIGARQGAGAGRHLRRVRARSVRGK